MNFHITFPYSHEEREIFQSSFKWCLCTLSSVTKCMYSSLNNSYKLFLFFSKRRLIIGFYYSHEKHINDYLLNWIIQYVGKTLCYHVKVKTDNHDLQFFGSGGTLQHITLIQVHTIVELLIQIWHSSMEMAFDTGMMVVKSNFW